MNFFQHLEEAEDVIVIANELSEKFASELVREKAVYEEGVLDTLKGIVGGFKSLAPAEIVSSYKKLYNSKVFSQIYAKLDTIMPGREAQANAIKKFVQTLSTGSVTDFLDNPQELKLALDELRTNAELLPMWKALKSTLSPNFVSGLEKISAIKPGETPEGEQGQPKTDAKEAKTGNVFGALGIKPFLNNEGKPANAPKLDTQTFQAVKRLKQDVKSTVAKQVADAQARSVFTNVIDSMLVQALADYDPATKKSNLNLAKLKRAVNLALKRVQPL